MLRFALPLLILAFPIVEIALLIAVGQSIGLWPTILIVLSTAALGAFVLQRQGINTWRRANAALAAGKPPIGPAIDGMFLLLAGAFLLSPGLVTDTLGLLLLIPAVRAAIAKWGAGWSSRHGVFRVVTFRDEPRQTEAAARTGRASPVQPEIIEGEFERLDERPARRSE